MKLQVKRRKSRIEIVPMIDVMFFMLIFFFLFSTLKTAQSGVDVELPKTVNLGEVNQNTIVISITKEQRIFFGKDSVGIDEMVKKASYELQRDPESRFVIKPDSVVPYVELIRVMDVLAGVGVKQPLLGVDRQQIPKSNLENRMERTGDDSI